MNRYAMRYKFLLFDADDTLLDFAAAERDGLTKTFAELGIPLDDGRRERYVILNKSLWKLHDEGKLTRDELLSFPKRVLKTDAGRTSQNTFRKTFCAGRNRRRRRVDGKDIQRSSFGRTRDDPGGKRTFDPSRADA